MEQKILVLRTKYEYAPIARDLIQQAMGESDRLD